MASVPVDVSGGRVIQIFRPGEVPGGVFGASGLPVLLPNLLPQGVIGADPNQVAVPDIRGVVSVPNPVTGIPTAFLQVPGFGLRQVLMGLDPFEPRKGRQQLPLGTGSAGQTGFSLDFSPSDRFGGVDRWMGGDVGMVVMPPDPLGDVYFAGDVLESDVVLAAEWFGGGVGPVDQGGGVF